MSINETAINDMSDMLLIVIPVLITIIVVLSLLKGFRNKTT